MAKIVVLHAKQQMCAVNTPVWSVSYPLDQTRLLLADSEEVRNALIDSPEEAENARDVASASRRRLSSPNCDISRGVVRSVAAWTESSRYAAPKDRNL